LHPILAALLTAGAIDSSGAGAVPAAPDSHRIVRHFPPVEVTAARVHDLRSSATVHIVTSDALRDLPLSSFAQAVALQPGVVLAGEDIHVRGGRAGETQWVLGGLTLNDPLRDRAPEVPILAVQRGDLLAGGLDAGYAGALAGVIDLHTWNPGEHPSGALRWLSTGRSGTAYDWFGARGSTPLGWAGLGAIAAGEARLDDQFLPQRPSRGRDDRLGRSFGWRNDNHLVGWAKLAPVANPQAASLEVLGSRVVREPFDPMFTWNDSVLVYFTNQACDLCPPFLDSLKTFYRAGDHEPLEETRSLATVLQAAKLHPRSQWRVSASWQRNSDLVSPGLTRDPRNLLPDEKVRFGQDMDPRRDAFRAYAGDWAYFKRSRSDRVQAAAAYAWTPSPTQQLEAGAGVRHDDVQSYELDAALPTADAIDSLRTYHTRAPGAWAYVQHRGEREGLLWNTGLRLQAFSAGDARAPRGRSPFGEALPDARGRGAIWTLSPRLGLVIPLGIRDAISASYARIHQDPPRDFLADDRLFIYSRRPLGTPTLEPSELLTYQMGWKHLIDPRWSVQLSLFHRDLFGQIGVVNDPYFTGTYRPRYANSEYGHATGVELALLAGTRAGATPGGTRRSVLRRFLAGEFSLRYTLMNAYGTISGPDGWAYGPPIGFRPVAIGEHPLDWDRGPVVGFDAVWREPRVFTLAWITQASGGIRWTPTVDTLIGNEPPGTLSNLTQVNSRQLPATERTNISLRLEPRFLRGARLLLDVQNLFDSRGEGLAAVAGYPNPFINSTRDDYEGYRTLTGEGGGAYWDPRLNGGRGGWVPVHDPRLERTPRSVRMGFEVGL